MNDSTPQDQNRQEQRLIYKNIENSREGKFETLASLKMLVYIEVDQRLGCLKQRTAIGEDKFFL